MSKKTIKFGTDARKSLQAGVNVVVKAVQTSFGPKGRTSVIGSEFGSPSVTNDGVTIAKSIELEGIEQAGVSLIQQAANKTNDNAGDGTTTTTILAGALINEGIKMVEAGADPVKLRNGIKKAVEFSLNKLNSLSTPITTIEEKTNVATISSRNEKVGKMVAHILTEVGDDGVVTVETGDGGEISMEIALGMQFDKGYKSPYFVTDTVKMECVVDKPLILVTDQKISSIQDVLPLIEEMASNGKKDLILIADDIDGDALSTFVVNKVRGLFNVYAVSAPSFGESRKLILEDIAILIGATFVSDELGMKVKDTKIANLGSCEKIKISKDSTTIIGGKGDKTDLENRVLSIKEKIANSTNDYEKEKLTSRVAKLVGGVGVLKVGAATEVEMKELKFVVEDAVNATKAAISEGVVAGGASTLVRLSKFLDEIKDESEETTLGINIVKKAFLSPFRAIASNSGIYDIALIIDRIKEDNNAGYDFAEMKNVDDMLTNGIIDPKKVIRESIMNSSSVACSVITTEVVVVDAPKANQLSSSPHEG